MLKPASVPDLTKTDLLEYYRQMKLIREFERESERQYTRGNIKGFLHVYNGEEAIAVGAINSLRSDDYVVTHYRDHGQALVRGISSNEVMAELMGKATGCSKGKGGSMHMFSSELNFMGGYAIVGGQLTIAAGIGMAIQYRGDDQVVLCFFGDGAVNEGEFHEAMNLAAIWKLPVVFFCEHNLYGMGASSKETLVMWDSLHEMAAAYGMDRYEVDGNDVLAVSDLMQKVNVDVRTGAGPAFIVAKTYRLRGHSVADPADYRPKEEVEYWASQDPIPRFREWLTEEGIATVEDFEEIDASVEEEVVMAAEFAESSPWPEPGALYEGVYSDRPAEGIPA
jgi:pyruvate dehydrogenase E1 component alpha subunit